MQQLSMIMLSYLILGYSFATSAQLWRNRPSPNFLRKQTNKKKTNNSNWFKSLYKSHKIVHVKRDFLLHDIGLVNSCDFVSALFGGIIEGKLGNASGFLSGDDLQTLNYPRDTLTKPKAHGIHKTAILTLYYRRED